MKKIHKHFKQNDPILYSVLSRIEFPILKRSDDLFVFLCESIISQQLSIKAADTIFARFKNLFPKEKINPVYTLKLSIEKIRSAGISQTKASYIKGLAENILKKQLNLRQIDSLSDEEIIIKLVKIKGIGRWTAEMFLMSALGREDVFSYGDLGIRKAIQKLYKLKAHPTPKEAEKIAKKWVPYRTYACKILWMSLNLTTVSKPPIFKNG